MAKVLVNFSSYKRELLLKKHGYLSTSMFTDEEKKQMSFDELKKYGSMDAAFKAGAGIDRGRTARALSKPFIIKASDFYGKPMESIMASGNGKRLWMLTQFNRNGAHVSYKIEKWDKQRQAYTDNPTIVKDFDQAIRTFNSC